MASRFSHGEMAHEMERMAHAKQGWLATFSAGKKKRPDHEIEAQRLHLAALRQAADEYRECSGEGSMKPNDIRDRALKACSDPKAAQDAWEVVQSDGRCHGKTSRACRLAMLQALADGGSVADAKRAAMAVLES